MSANLLDLMSLDRALTQAERRRMTRQSTQPKGYAAPPGTGPDGETCKTCQHLYRHRLAKTYLKCKLMSAVWTGSGGTDVLASAPACRRWAAPLPSPNGERE